MRVEWLSNAAVLLLWAPLLFLCLGLIVSVCLPWPWSEAARVVTGMAGLSYYYGMIIIEVK